MGERYPTGAQQQSPNPGDGLLPASLRKPVETAALAGMVGTLLSSSSPLSANVTADRYLAQANNPFANYGQFVAGHRTNDSVLGAAPVSPCNNGTGTNSAASGGRSSGDLYPAVATATERAAAADTSPAVGFMNNRSNNSSSIVSHLRAAALGQTRLMAGAGVAPTSLGGNMEMELLERARLLELSMIDAERRAIVNRMCAIGGGSISTGSFGFGDNFSASAPVAGRPTPQAAFASHRNSSVLEEALLLSAAMNARSPFNAPTASLAALLASNDKGGSVNQNVSSFVPLPKMESGLKDSRAMASPSPSVQSVNVPTPVGSPIPPRATKAPKQCVVLYMDCDEESLSDYQCLIRKHMELFAVSDADGELAGNVQGRNKQVTKGQVGLRCRHCAAFNLKKRAAGDGGLVKGAMFFPTKLARIYQAAQNLSTYHLADACPCVPADVKQQIRLLRERKSPAGGGKRYWAESVRCQGVYEDGHGLRFR